MAEMYQHSNLGPFPYSVPQQAPPNGSATGKPTEVGAPPTHYPSPPPQPYTRSTPALYGTTTSSLVSLIDVALRISASVLCLIALAVMASDSKGDYKFKDVYAYKYVVSISAIGLFYSLVQTLGGIFCLVSGSTSLISSYSTYIGDQIMAYLCISAASAGATVTMELQDGCDANGQNSFCSQAAGSISTLFIAFAVIVSSSIMSSYKLFKRVLAPSG